MRPSLPRTAALVLLLTGSLPVTSCTYGGTDGSGGGIPRTGTASCTVHSGDLDTTVDRRAGTATTTASWNVSCPRPASVTAELRVCAPGRTQQQVKSGYGTRFTDSASASGSTGGQGGGGRQTAVLAIREGGEVIGERVQRCGTGREGSGACRPSGDRPSGGSGSCG